MYSPAPVMYSLEPVMYSPEPVMYSLEPVMYSPEPVMYSLEPVMEINVHSMSVINHLVSHADV